MADEHDGSMHHIGGDTPGMRSIAEQSVEELGGRGSVLAIMRREHGELDALLERLAS